VWPFCAFLNREKAFVIPLNIPECLTDLILELLVDYRLSIALDEDNKAFQSIRGST
jgi:hypothetical protein